MRQVAAGGSGVGLTNGVEWWGEHIAGAEQLQRGAVGERRFLQHDAVDDYEAGCGGGLRIDQIGEVGALACYERHDQRPFGELAILRWDAGEDCGQHLREIDG